MTNCLYDFGKELIIYDIFIINVCMKIKKNVATRVYTD